MTKFILIDHSLGSIGGHHFEYALHVLRAADRAGFGIWLATNRRFQHEDKLPPHWQIRPVYEYTTYTRHRFSIDEAPEGKRSKYHFLVPRWLRRQWTDRRREQRVTAFARDTAALLGEIDLQPGDQVLIPTMSELDLMGLGQYLGHDSRTRRIDWHLQFHFPIFVGCEPDYAGQDERVANLRKYFAAAIAPAADHRLHFYTTTDQLTVQFNRLAAAPFQTLPYPVNPTLQAVRQPIGADRQNDAQDDRRPLRITYLGDARDEKGYQYLPAIVGDMWRKYVETDRARFIVQSNFHFSQSAKNKHAVVLESLAALKRFPQDKIELLEKPLGSEEFCRLVQATDVGLLLYNRKPYFSRCSGVLVELLTAGRPVLTSAGCWMADQLAEATREYHTGLRHAGRMLSRARVQPLSSLAAPTDACDMLLFFHWPKDLGAAAGAYVRAETTFVSADGNLLDQWESVIGPGKAGLWNTALIRVPPGAVAASVDWRNAYSAEPVQFQDVEACFLGADAHGDRLTPRGAVGLVAATPSQASELLQDMIDNIDHYRHTAAQFARNWSAWHNPDRVVAELLSQRQALPMDGGRTSDPMPLPRGNVG